MRSDGGLEGAQTFSGHRAVLSGPAAGVVGMAKCCFDTQTPVIGFDMGGARTFFLTLFRRACFNQQPK